ncbi:DNA repair protein RecO [Patescibacteria group bacterium AH-259-L05]|nr:DNA repair protein RecO [Patescibacteria group bacterium AH-259-L05]
MSSDEYITGVVLQTRDYKESDRIVYVYSQEYGKVEVLVRGARKIISKLAPLVAEPFALVRLKVVKGKAYYHCIGGEVQERFYNIGKRYSTMTSIAELFNKINAIVKKYKSDAKIFSLLITFLQKANTPSQEKITILIPAFLIKFLAFLGYRPEIRMCVVCRSKELETDLFFDFKKGGIVCKKHGSDNEEKKEISSSVLYILQQLLYKKLDFLVQQKFSKKDLRLAVDIINQFYQWQLE